MRQFGDRVAPALCLTATVGRGSKLGGRYRLGWCALGHGCAVAGLAFGGCHSGLSDGLSWHDLNSEA